MFSVRDNRAAVLAGFGALHENIPDIFGRFQYPIPNHETLTGCPRSRLRIENIIYLSASSSFQQISSVNNT